MATSSLEKDFSPKSNRELQQIDEILSKSSLLEKFPVDHEIDWQSSIKKGIKRTATKNAWMSC